MAEGEEPVSQEVAAALESGADEAAGDKTEFTPKVQVEEVEVKTLEEDEEVVFVKRAKLFLFVAKDTYGGEERTNFWKERGTGELKLLKHKEFGKVRLLMRQDKTYKICANHLVSPHVLLKPNVGSDRSWVFTASDFADEELKTETFAVKFGTVENAKLFQEKMEAAKKVNAGELGAEALEAITADGEEKPADKASEESAAKPADSADALADDMSKVALCGGYKEADKDSEEVKEAAKFACEKLDKGELAHIAEAATQVVSGTNFRIVVHIKHAEDDALHKYLVTVFKPLPHEEAPMELKEHVHNGTV